MPTVFRTKYLAMNWGDYSFAQRKWRFRHNRRVHSIYLQFGPVEINMWYC